MHTQNILPDSICAALVAHPDRKSGVRLSVVGSSEPRLPKGPPAERPEPWDFATALRAYAKTRGRAPSVLAGLVRASSASEES